MSWGDGSKRYIPLARAVQHIGLLVLTGAYHYEAIIVPTVAVEVPALIETFPRGSAWVAYRVAVAVSGIATWLGFVLFRVAMLRTRLLPGWAIGAASGGAMGAGVQFALPRSVSPGAIFLIGLGLVGLGYGLWASVSTAEPN